MHSSPGKQITLIGTVHRDPQGEDRLVRLLSELSPDVITLEMSPKTIEHRKIHARPLLLRLERILEQLAEERQESREDLAHRPRIKGIFNLLAFPFEYRAAEAYASPRQIPLKMADLGSVSLKKLQRIERGLINKRNIKALLDSATEEEAPLPENYTNANHLLAHQASAALRDSFLKGRRGSEGIGPRDAIMAGVIEDLLRTRPGHLVHIGGWVHMVDDPQGETLRSRLNHFNPSCRLLI